MDGLASLNEVMAWHRAVPPSRRAGRAGRFSMSPEDVEQYVSGLRRVWARHGSSVLLLANIHRHELERQVRVAIRQVREWLAGFASTVAPVSGRSEAVIRQWATRWGEKLSELQKNPLSEPPGETLGIGPLSSFLPDFGWWRAPKGANGVLGGPLEDLPNSVGRQAKGRSHSKSEFAAAFRASLEASPDFVNDVHVAVAESPWTAAFVLNAMLSDKGVLPASPLAPSLDHALSLPTLRTWMDHLAPTFTDWRLTQFTTNVEERSRLEISDIRQMRPNRVQATPDKAISDARQAQRIRPVVPSAYIVTDGTGPLDLAVRYPHASSFLSARQGQCVVFEFLLTRLAHLRPRDSGTDGKQATPPFIEVVVAQGRPRYSLRVNSEAKKRLANKGVVDLLYLLDRNGFVEDASYKSFTDLLVCVPELDGIVKREGQKRARRGRKGKNIISCHGEELCGLIQWPPNYPTPTGI